MNPPNGLALAFLGGYEVRLNGQPLGGISYATMRALLAYLAVERERDHPRDELAAMLWPENDAATARGNLRRTLADLRRVIEQPMGAGRELFVAQRESIRLVPGFALDVREFANSAVSGAGPAATPSTRQPAARSRRPPRPAGRRSRLLHPGLDQAPARLRATDPIGAGRAVHGAGRRDMVAPMARGAKVSLR